jgi:hypothetical protein
VSRRYAMGMGLCEKDWGDGKRVQNEKGKEVGSSVGSEGEEETKEARSVTEGPWSSNNA